MELRPPAVRELLEQLEQLPGVGPRTATRLVQHMVRAPQPSRRLAEALAHVADAVRHCSTCFLLTEDDPCPVCRDEGRDRAVICVVEDPLNAWAVEATAEFGGLYHVLGGTLDPLHGIGPDELTIAGLLDRVRAGGVREVILATNPTVEGEATAHYVARALRPLGCGVSRIAFGLPAGGEISYADSVTLTRALAGRRGMD
jgi:recombination protein RecR